MTDKASNTYVPGLEGIVASRTRLSSVDGKAGELIIAGFPVEELADKASFEETVYLLWHDALPDADELTAFRRELAEQRELSPATINLLREAAKSKVHQMDALRMGVSTLSLDNPEQSGKATLRRDAVSLIAKSPTIVAAYTRLLNGQEPVAPRANLGHTANYLYMLTGEEPSEGRVRGLETYLNTVVDHGLNASTFTARVIISTESDMISAVTGAIGSLKGPLHGGAPGPALAMVFDIGESSKAESFMRSKLERGERLMGFGHRVYKVRDPRAEVLSLAAERMFKADGDMSLYNLTRDVEQTAIKLLDEFKPGRNLRTNVEFYTALLLHGLGLEIDLFTPTFAVGRVGGWTAHCLEQMEHNRIFRPQSQYTGVRDCRFIPVEDRD